MNSWPSLTFLMSPSSMVVGVCPRPDCKSIEPILETQPGDFLEILSIRCQQHRVMHKCDASRLEVHAADFDSSRAHFLKSLGCAVGPWSDVKFAEELEQSAEF